MPIESIEVTLIFFIMFVASMSIIYLFSVMQSNYLKNINNFVGTIAENNFFLDYIYAKRINSSVIRSTPTTTHQVFVIGNPYGVYIQILNTNVIRHLNTTDVTGEGTNVIYIYNDKGTIHIVS